MMTVGLFWFEFPIRSQNSVVWVRCLWVVLLGRVGWLSRCMEWCSGGSGVHGAWYRGGGSSVSSAKKLVFLHPFSVDIFIMFSGLYHLSECVGYGDDGHFSFHVTGEARVDYATACLVPPLNMRGTASEE